MAYTSIHPITATVNKAIDYITSDKTKLIQSKDNDNEKNNYKSSRTGNVKNKTFNIERDENGYPVIYKTKITTLNCSAKDTDKAFKYIKDMHLKKRSQRIKNNGETNLAWHCIQSFDGVIDKDIANEIGKKLAEECFEEFQCVITTHTNTENTHNHIIFNAWEIGSGRKYNDCEETYRKIRTTSDRLCREYGLPVLEETEDFTLAKWKDENGKTHSFEPTKRKNSVRPMEYADANDYRNTSSYTNAESHKKNNREVIKSDIDELFTSVKSYEELLQKLRDIGYEIKAKKVNGDWREHVSFKAPLQEKYTRDYKLGEEYIREALTESIAERNRQEEVLAEQIGTLEEESEEKQEVNADAPRLLEDYETLGSVVNSIDENFRERKTINNRSYDYVERGEIEKVTINDLKTKYNEIQQTHKQSMIVVRDEQEPMLKNKRSQYLLDCINANLRTLKFVEEKDIKSFDDICTETSNLYDKWSVANTELNKINDFIQKASRAIDIIEKTDKMRVKIESQKENNDYRDFEMVGDEKQLKKYEEALLKMGFDSQKKQESFVESYNKFNFKYNQLTNSLKEIDMQIKEYDNCVKVLSRIDKERQQYASDIKEYSKMKRANQNRNHKDR